MTESSLVVVGDVLLDCDVDGTAQRLSPEAPVPVLDERSRVLRPGGAGLAAALAARDGVPVTLVTALGDDEAASELRWLLSELGVRVLSAALRGSTPEKIRLRAGDHPFLRLDRGDAATPVGQLPPDAVDAVAGAGVVVVSDYGRGLTSRPELRRALARRRLTLWDPHPRGADPVRGTTLVTPNLAELLLVAPGPAGSLADIAARAEEARRRWRIGAVVVTRGEQGAVLVTGAGAPLAVPVERAHGDPCGAGDRFVTWVANRLLAGAVLTEAVADAVAVAGRFVGGRGAASLTAPAPDSAGDRGPGPVVDAASRVGAVQRLVVAGGCFDVLHAGHVSLLSAARRLGDRLVVALNSDASVRRLKGQGRPVNPEADRRAVLRALASVDDVAVFHEDSPIQLLRRLQPAVFAKGGDYAARQLPEESVLAEWGGQVVVLPYLSGRSTTRLLQATRQAR